MRTDIFIPGIESTRRSYHLLVEYNELEAALGLLKPSLEKKVNAGKR